MSPTAGGPPASYDEEPAEALTAPMTAQVSRSSSSSGNDPSRPDAHMSKLQSTVSRRSYAAGILAPGGLTPAILSYQYPGSGTEEDPYAIDFLPDEDSGNPIQFAPLKKWSITLLVAFATLAVAFVSSAYSGGIEQLIMDLHTTEEVAVLGISLFVLGFAIGPLIFAPLSELYGRQAIFIGTYGILTAFNAGAAGAPNIGGLVAMRFLAGAFGSSVLTNAGGVIADMFLARERGLAMSVFAAAPFMGPTLGPIVGGFVGQSIGWRWTEGVMAIFTGVLWILGSILIPETYAPVLLRKRAATLSKHTGKIYRSKVDVRTKPPSPGQAFKKALGRPWVLLFREPIVLLLSIYMAIVYGTLYMMFAAFPIVFQEGYGFNEGLGGCAFLGVAVGMIAAVIYTFPDNGRYNKAVTKAEESGKLFAAPEARLPPAMIGSVCLPVGLFWFAWTNSPSVHWIVPIIATVPFGFGMVLVFLSIMNYLIDAYTIYAASVLAANSTLRSVFGAVFPLFTTYMYQNLGVHWASSIPAFLALMCVPFPFLLFRYGPTIRRKCKFAREAEDMLVSMRKGEVGREKEKEGEAVLERGKRVGEQSEDRDASNDKDVEKGIA
ncbi:MFS siderochrome iron transporter 1 [Agyrium rufum]|nr:MFS siderochrome iron transporter 1 [Agyrium rufum]